MFYFYNVKMACRLFHFCLQNKHYLPSLNIDCVVEIRIEQLFLNGNVIAVSFNL